MNILDKDYVVELKAYIESKNFNQYRMSTEPAEWWVALWNEIDLFIEAETFDIFVKTFKSDTAWSKNQASRSIRISPDEFKVPIVMQWTVTNFGKNLELAVKKLVSS